MKIAHFAAISGLLVLGCSGGPRLPKEASFEGIRLEKATEWSFGDVKGIVFVPPGEKLETASLQVGLLASSEYSSGSELHAWVMEQYRGSPTAQWHESATSDEACKIGLPQGPPRPFVAIHVCRTGVGVAACAEADERLSDEVMGRCLNRGWGCWDELCSQKWDSRRAALENLVRQVLPPQ